MHSGELAICGTLPCRDPIRQLCISPDGLLIASAGGDGVAKVWDGRSSEELRTLTGHTDRVTGITFDPVGRCIASASEDQTVRLWDAHTGTEIHTLLGHAGQVNAVAFAPLATASRRAATMAP